MQKTLSQKLLDVQRVLNPVVKGSDNPYFKSKYTGLNEVLSVCKPILNEAGIFIAQDSDRDQFGSFMRTALIDAESNQSISTKVYYSGNEKNMQELISSGTYGARAGLKRLLAMEDTDDDGESAVGRPQTQTTGKASTGPSASRDVSSGDKSGRESKASTPVQSKVSTGTSRKTINETISLTTKVLVDSKRMSQDEVVKMLTSFGVKTKEELNDDQAAKLLKQYEDKLNAK